jgi:hypothetical protein
MISIFEKNFKVKKIFDPNDANDVKCYKSFLKNSSWGVTGCPFILENPYLSIPHMIQDKIVRNLLKVKYEQSNS